MANKISRRHFLAGAAAISYVSLWPTSPLGTIGMKSAAAQVPAGSQPVLVNICLRGGADGVSLVAPLGDPDHASIRAGYVDQGGFANRTGIDIDGYFAFHNSFASMVTGIGLSELCVVHAVHTDDPTQSHFAAIDLSDAGNEIGGDGWIGRAAAAAGLIEPMNQISVGSFVHPVMRSSASGTVVETIAGLQMVGGSTGGRREALEAMYDQARPDEHASLTTMLAGIDATSSIQQVNLGNYPTNNFEGPALREAAALIKADIGVANVAINSGNVANGGRWDTHAAQAELLPGMIGDLGQALAAFREDLGVHWDRTIVLIQSEFGRSLSYEEDASSTGTNHGAAGAYILAGGPLASGAGGTVVADWKGLGTGGTFQRSGGVLLTKTTDTRAVLIELLERHLGLADASALFPSFDRNAHPDLNLLLAALLGDVDRSGQIDRADVQRILDGRTGIADGVPARLGDLNRDASVDIADALELAQQLGQ